jgi:hypothetical protein
MPNVFNRVKGIGLMMTLFPPPPKMGMTWAALDLMDDEKRSTYMMGLFSFFAINFLSFVPFQKEKEKHA